MQDAYSVHPKNIILYRILWVDPNTRLVPLIMTREDKLKWPCLVNNEYNSCVTFIPETSGHRSNTSKISSVIFIRGA